MSPFRVFYSPPVSTNSTTQVLVNGTQPRFFIAHGSMGADPRGVSFAPHEALANEVTLLLQLKDLLGADEGWSRSK